MPVRIGVIGTGAIGRDHSRRINQVLGGAKIVALSDVNRASTEAVRKDVAPVATIFETGEALITSPDVDAADGDNVYKLVHDTFHHHLADETDFFPQRTGLVHISGVVDSTVEVNAMLDAHRVLVDGDDRLENIPQIKALIAAGYEGPYSFEPFAEDVHALGDPEKAVRESMAYVSANL